MARKRKRKSDAPAEVLNVLDGANMIPRDADLTDFRETMLHITRAAAPAWSKAIRVYDAAEHPSDEDLNRQTKILAEISRKFADVVLRKIDEPLRPLAYHLGSSVTNESLDYLIEECKRRRGFLSRLLDAARDEQTIKTVPIEITKIYYFAGEELKSPGIDEFYSLVSKLNRSQFNRILECPFCGRFVWKKRTDALTCGKRKCVDLMAWQKRKGKNSLERRK